MNSIEQCSRTPQGSSFVVGDEIGICVVDGADKTYDKINYPNVKYTYSLKDGNMVWNATDGNGGGMLSGSDVTLYAYYPYTEGLDITKIALDMDNQTDWLYATPVSELNNSNAATRIVMNHALSNIKLSIIKGNYVGKGEISRITVKLDAIAKTGYLNAKTGKITVSQSAGNVIAKDVDMTLSSTEQQIDVLVIPNTNKVPVTLELAIDGKQYGVSSEETEILNGNS